MRLFLAFALFATPAAADDRSAFYGSWGTAKQCMGAPIQASGTVVAAPFEIDDAFLKHGNIWCRLTWSPIEQRDGTLVTGAQALCGEDSVQGYQLGLELSDGVLSLRWGLLQSNRGLGRCGR